MRLTFATALAAAGELQRHHTFSYPQMMRQQTLAKGPERAPLALSGLGIVELGLVRRER